MDMTNITNLVAAAVEEKLRTALNAATEAYDKAKALAPRKATLSHSEALPILARGQRVAEAALQAFMWSRASDADQEIRTEHEDRAQTKVMQRPDGTVYTMIRDVYRIGSSINYGNWRYL